MKIYPNLFVPKIDQYRWNKMKINGDRFGCGTEILSNERNISKELTWKNKMKKNFRSLVEEGRWKWTIEEDVWQKWCEEDKAVWRREKF